MHSFIIDESAIENGIAKLDRDESRHAKNVFRLSEGDDIVLTDGKGNRYSAVVQALPGTLALCARIKGELPDNESNVNITVLLGSLKSDKLEIAVQKLTEVGVTAIIPVNMSRSVAQPDDAKKGERLEKIAREAVKQSTRARIPSVRGLIGWKEAIKILSEADLSIMPWEKANGTRIKDAHATKPDAKNIAILIGPEGGITPEEVCEAEKAGAVTVTLGPRILRAETAAIAAASVVQSLWGDL